MKKPDRQPLFVAVAALAAVVLFSCGEYSLWHWRGVGNEWAPILRATWIVAGASALLAGALGFFLPRYAALAVGLLPAMVLFGKTATRVVGLSGSLAWVVAWVIAAALGVGIALAVRNRAALGTAVVLAGAFLGLGWLQHRTTQPDLPAVPQESRPDIILLVLDTTRRDRLSVYGYDRPTTPRLERLGRRAQVYDQAWGVAPWTPPSHATMFTGLLPAEHGVDGQGTSPSLTEGLITLPEILASVGYRTGGFPANAILTAPGWDRIFHTYQSAPFASKHTFVPWLNRFLRGKTAQEREDHQTAHMFERTRDWWKAHADGPRFAFINLMDAHRKYHPQDQDFAEWVPGVTREEANEIDAQFWERFDPVHYTHAFTDREYEILNLLYDGEIIGMDREIGRFLDWLEARGELDDTILVITSDHGERLGERGVLGHKLSQDPYLLHVPLIVSWPARLPPERIQRRVQIDGLAAYLLELAELPIPDHMAPPISGQDRDIVTAQFRHPQGVLDDLARHIDGFDASPYEGDWMYAMDRDGFAYEWPRRETPVPGRLTDFNTDPGFTRDVSADHPERVERLRDAVEALPEFGEAQEFDPSPAMLEKLRALGYIQ